MGALTNYRKRGDDYYYKSLVTTLAPIDRSDIHIAKKHKLSLCPAQPALDSSCPLLLKSIASKVANYPDRKSAFLREVHAPVRNSRVGIFFSANRCETAASSKESPLMGKFSFFNRFYVQPWAAAYRNSQYVSEEKEKEKRVIEVDSDDRDGAIDDASIEELKIVNSAGRKRKIRQKDVEISQERNLEMFKTEFRSSNSSILTNACDAVVEVDDGDKIDFMQLDLGSDDSGLAWYRESQDRIGKKHDGKLQSLDFEIEINVKGMQWNQLLRSQKKEEQIKRDVANDCFMPLTEKEKREVSAALSNSNRREILVSHENSNIDITGEKLQCLRPGAWLNDEVINLYLELLKEREKREPKKFLKCHFFNTFFYKKLISGKGGYDYPSVRRWTTYRKLGYHLLECDKIFVPIHKEVHWCLAIINQKDRKFQYLDSLGGVDTRVLNVLAKYFVDEVKDKCGESINCGSWEREFVTDIPQQANGFDCGVFMIKYADFCSSRGIGLCFSQEHMPYFRCRTAKEILQLKAD